MKTVFTEHGKVMMGAVTSKLGPLLQAFRLFKPRVWGAVDR
ncbi:hypothetical protein A2U01_0046857, partial [Trifolium medium]|nr:hypothetical protein [Trifolium medium]